MIRLARTEDAESIAVLESDSFAGDAWSLAQVNDELAAPTRTVIVAEDDHGLVGYAAVAVVADCADLTRIVVGESFRRSGIASLLLAAVQEAALRAGATRTLLEVADSNDGARAFYAAHGYVEIARRQRYYSDGGDAVVLERLP